jgi:MFS family permease
MYFILFVDRVNVSTAGPLIAADLKLGNTELGLVFSAFAIPYALFQLLGGWIGDRFGAWLILTLCLVIVGVSTALTGVAGGLASLVATRLAVGFGEGAAFPTATRAMANWTPAGSWGFAQGIVHAAARIGNAVTPPLVTALLAFGSWRVSFVILGLASLLWPATWMWFFRDDPRNHPGITPEHLATLPLRAARSSSQGVPWLRLARRMLPVTIVDFCYGWTLWLFLSWIPSFFFQNYHLNLQSSALFATGVFVAGVLGDALGGLASDTLLRKTSSLVAARRYVIIAGFVGAFVFLLPVVLIHELNVAAICLSLAFFFLELIVGPIWSIPMDIAPRYAGSASGMMNFGFGIAGIVSPFSFGYLVDRTGGWVFPFVASLVLLPVGAVLATRLRPDQPFLAIE